MQPRHYMLLLIGGHYRSARRLAWAILDPADYEWAKRFNWQLREDHRTAYARRTIAGTGRKRRMHRELLGLSDGDPRGRATTRTGTASTIGARTCG